MLEKWSINRLATETGKDRRTLKKWLEQTEPADFQEGAPVYHLRDFIAVIEGRSDESGSSLEKETTRHKKAMADRAEFDLAIAKKEFVPVEIAFQTVSNMLFAVRRTIEMSALNNEEKDSIYTELQSLKADDFASEAKFEEGA